MRWIVLAAVIAASACKKGEPDGLKPAKDWNVDQGGGAGIATPRAQAPANPHAGMDMGGGGGGAGTNPHAGMDMGGGGGGAGTNPHAGMDMTPSNGPGNLPPPDPNRQLDPNHHVKGTISIDPKAADKVKAGTAVFLKVQRLDAAGVPSGPPLAVEKLIWQDGGLPFELSEANAMIAGTQLVGEVAVTARYDQDGDAGSKQPGDVTGTVRVTIPAENVKLVLDTVL